MPKAPTAQVMEPEDDTIEVAMNEATHAQLMWFSQLQNLDVDPAETANQTYARLKAVWDHPTIKVPRVIEEPAKLLSRIEVTTAEDRYGLPETVDVIVQGDGLTEDDTVKVAHNGTAYIIQVGKTVTLPWYVYKILEDAKEIRYTTGRDAGLGPSVLRQAVQFTRVR